MDEQDPRLAAERITGFDVNETNTADRISAEPRTSTRRSGRGTAGTPASRTTADYSSSSEGTDASDTPRTREIRADIEQTREELSETVTAIQERLRPGNVAANAADTVKQAASEKAREMVDSEPVQYVRSNPIPTAMIGIGIAGLAWLAFGGREANTRNRRYGYRSDYDYDYDYERTRDTQLRTRQGSTGYASSYASSQAGESGYGGYTGSGETAGESYGGMTRRSGRYGGTSGRASQVASRAQGQLSRTWQESPLLIGAAAMVAGAIVGLGVPETERENQLMGEARDSMVENVQRTVGDKVSQVQNAATEAVNRVQDVAKNVTGMTTDDNTTTNR